jgi:hypothetical protein
LYGLNGEDVFDVDANAQSRIKLRIIGGRGEDTFNLKGKVRNYLYDLSTEKNVILNKNKSRDHFESEPSVNRYSQTGFQYNRNTFPNINFGFNPEDGLMLGLGFSRRTYAFRKDPYSTFQRLSPLYAFASGSYKVNYRGEFNYTVGRNDIVINGEIGKPTLNNFFGIGNNTKFDREKDIEFYRVRYNYLTGDVLLRRRVADFFHISAGPTVYNYWNHLEDNDNKILGSPSLVGLDSASVYQTKTYAGGKLQLLINNVNNAFLPTRGVNWLTQFTSYAGVNDNSRPLTTLTSDMTVYSSLSDPAGVVSILKVGGGHIFNDDYQYFQALSVGQNNFLRGFRKNRFSGKSMAYGSLTLLIKLVELKSYVFPGSIGIIAYDDVGRVWAKNQSSGKWHNAVGGGLYYSPINMLILSGSLAFSGEEKLFNVSLGSRFNLTF